MQVQLPPHLVALVENVRNKWHLLWQSTPDSRPALQEQKPWERFLVIIRIRKRCGPTDASSKKPNRAFGRLAIIDGDVKKELCYSKFACAGIVVNTNAAIRIKLIGMLLSYTALVIGNSTPCSLHSILYRYRVAQDEYY